MPAVALCIDADACLANGSLTATDREAERNIQSQRSDLCILFRLLKVTEWRSASNLISIETE